MNKRIPKVGYSHRRVTRSRISKRVDCRVPRPLFLPFTPPPQIKNPNSPTKRRTSRRKFGFEGFSLNRQPTYSFERPQRLYAPPHDQSDDHNLDNISYDDSTNPNSIPNPKPNNDEEIDPPDAFMEGMQQQIQDPTPNKQVSNGKYDDDEEEDLMESFLKVNKDVRLMLAADATRAGYNSDEEVYRAAKAVDAGMVEYDSDDNLLVVEKRKIEPIPALDHGSTKYDSFCKD